ncbi:MAG: hypothetical protein PHQ89_02585 [Bacilli bacterium]|nr:hypothetical protein [Bacilli bacterium]
MNFKKIICLFSFIFLFLPIVAKADSCSTDEKSVLQKKVNQIQIIYEFNNATKKYDITINGFSYEFYALDTVTNKYLYYDGNSTILLQNYEPGVSYVLKFYGKLYNGCNDEFLSTKSVLLPYYNQYSENPLCAGYETYELCKKFTPIKISSEEIFISRLNAYKKSLENKDPVEEENISSPTETIWNKMLSFFVEYNLYFLLPIIIGGTTIIIVIEAKKRKSIL